MNIIPTALRTSANLDLRIRQSATQADQIRETLGERTQDQVLLKVDPSLTPEEVQELAADYGATVGQEFHIPESMKAAFNGKLLLLETGPQLDEAQTLAVLEGDERVLLAAVNDTMSLSRGSKTSRPISTHDSDQGQAPFEKVPNDLRPEQWGLRNSNAPGGKIGADISATRAWTVTTGGGTQGPIIAVLDSGIDAYHEDLKANMWKNPHEEADGQDNNKDGFVDDIHGLNAVDGSGNVIDEVGHGTHVAGIIGATGNNGLGVTGVNWETQLMAIKIADGDRVSLVAAISGTLYAAEHGVRIANHSWGGSARNPILEDVMKSAPMLHICAAGNSQRDSDQQPFYPAGFDAPNILSVGASAQDDSPLFFSNWGQNSVDLHAPGARIFSTLPVHGYDELSGTSMAAPHVSGVAGLIASKYPQATNEDIKNRLIYSTDPIEEMRRLSVSGGRLNAFKALEEDNVPPAEITDFILEKTNADGFTVSWNGVGDDGMEGVVSRYELIADFGDKRERLAPEFPQAPGSRERFSFQTVPQDTERNFTLHLSAVDNVGNRSSSLSLDGTIPKAEAPLSSDFDSEDNWVTDGKWAKTPEPGRGLVYTDSPEGAHEPGSDTSLTSPVFSLKGLKNSFLSFDAKMVTNEYDFLFVEVNADGKGWKNLSVLRRDKTPGYGEWGSYRFDLSPYDRSESFQVRFNYEPAKTSKEDGVWIDNVKVLAAKDTTPPRS